MSNVIARRTFLSAGALAPAVLAAGRRPNVLWLMTDEQRPDSLGCYGTPWARTPNLDALAASGTLFESAYVPAPVCVACRSSLLTGRRASSNGVLHNQARLTDRSEFLTWRFSDAGYQTASFGKKHYYVQGRQAFEVEAGTADDIHVNGTGYLRGHKPSDWDALIYESQAPEGLRRSWVLSGQFPAPEEESAERVNTRLAMDWLAALDASRPFFMRLSLNAPHTPVVAPRRCFAAIDADAIRLPVPTEEQLRGQPAREREALRPFQGTGHLSPEAIRRLRHAYYVRVHFMDEVIGDLLRWMRPRGLLQNTIIAFMSDHGTHLADQGLLQKQTFYEQVATVPFLLAWPGELGAGQRVAESVHVGGLVPTLLDLAGLSPLPAQFQSLAPSLRKQAASPNGPVFSELAYGYQRYRDEDRQVMVRAGDYKMIRFQDPADPARFRGNEDGALYHLRSDPHETRNLYSDPRHAQALAALSAHIADWDRRFANDGRKA